MKSPSSKISHFFLYSGCVAGVAGFAIITMGGSIADDTSSHASYLRSVGSLFSDAAFPLIVYAAIAVFFGRRGVLLQEAEAAGKKEPIQPPETTRGK
jgi:ABC-type Mn2+/Zn2+ transport system permease subunit